ncbi:MAG: hypothetical protein AAB677_00770 [Patescibacteria group bacterium]
MKIVTVIPLARGLFQEELTYFTSQAVEPGAIVSIAIKRRTVEALVTAVQSVAEIKAAVRMADFSLKKVLRIKHHHFFSPTFLTVARQMADYFASPFGLVLKNLVPAAVLSEPSAIGYEPTARRTNKLRAEKYLLQEADDERLIHYKSLVREEFARGASVFLGLPTLTRIKQAQQSLERGITDYTFVFHHSFGRKNLLAAWSQALTTKHPILIIGTPGFLSLPRADLGTVIIDEESSAAYKGLVRPYLDYRIFAEKLAAANGWRFVLGDFVLRTETLYRLKQGSMQTKMPLKHHAVTSAEQKIVKVANVDGQFHLLSEELIGAIEAANRNNERFFIYVHRRGLTPLVVCQDCGTAVTCANCDAPVSWHEESLFLCHHCGAHRSAAEKCAVCDSWRLIGLGVGIEAVVKELAVRLPALKIFELDSDRIKTESQAAMLVKKFMATPGSVLIGTELAINHLKEKIENTAVAAIDSLFALPDYRINEKIFRLLIRLRALAGKSFLLQVRNVKSRLFELARRGSLLEFYQQDLAERREYHYPPFRLFIKITAAGAKEKVLLALKTLEQKLAGYEFDVFPPSSGGHSSTEFALNLLLRLSSDRWPDPSLVKILRTLPPEYTVNVDPENLLN